MEQTKKLKRNSISSLINRLVLLVSGLILPRLIILEYGSEINGLVSSITQFLSVITFLDLGVGAVVQSALYKPLATNDDKQISRVLLSAKRFFQKISLILVIYVVILIFLSPSIFKQEIQFTSTAILIGAIAFNQFSRFYFGIINELLLNADQKSYVQLSSETLTVILNTFISVLLILNGFSIVAVKLGTAIIYLIRPIFLSYYVNKNYNVDYSVTVNEEPIKQKWNGVAQHLASVVFDNIDIIILSVFSTLENVSVYSVHAMVTNGIKMIITSLTTGMQSFFGNLLSKEKFDDLNNYFTRFEWIIHTAVTYLFGMTAFLITPFVTIYTSGVKDASYYSPTFAILISIAIGIYSLRLPYNEMIKAAGHYKQTQNSALIEVVINISISIVGVRLWGLPGVAVGTLLAVLYRLAYMALYLSKNIVYRPIGQFLKHFMVDCLSMGLGLLVSFSIPVSVLTITDWLFYAIAFGVIYFLISLIINLTLYKDVTVSTFKHLFRSL